MKIHNSQRKLRTAEARKLHLAERAGKGVLSAADQVLFFQKSKATSKEAVSYTHLDWLDEQYQEPDFVPFKKEQLSGCLNGRREDKKSKCR